MSLDVNLFFYLNSFAGKSQIFDGLIVFFSAYLQYLLAVVFLLFLFFSAHPKRKKSYIFWTTACSIIIARFGITEIIRIFYQRPRPFMTYQVHQLLAENEWSFPSGHAAFFFAMAAAIYFYNKKWGIGFFLAAMVISISRIIAGVHYPSDIIGGMLVGVAVAYLVFYFAEKWNNHYLREISAQKKFL